MIILVNDANILIDLMHIGLLNSFFQLGYRFQVTDMVFAELLDGNAAGLTAFIDNGILSRQGFSFEELLRIQLIEVENPALSIADCSCLFLSQKNSATLLTGDAALRRIAEQNNIPVHGILWAFDAMVDAKIITKHEANDSLERLMELNPRLPSLDCTKRLKLWSKGG
ncbi:MAG: PIN domain-containing protein [Desulfobulbaceae bacterium]